jgi:DNA polymerase-3 subunit alpha
MFIHLRTHSHYSLLSALPKIKALVAAAKDDGQTALALTDYANMYGAIEFYKECNKKGIKPILGAELYIAPRDLVHTEHGIDDHCFHIVLLAENIIGYKNLMELISFAQIDGLFVKPRISKEILKKYSSGLIALSGGMEGDIAHVLKQGDLRRAEILTREYVEIFGEDNFFLEISHRPKSEYGESVLELTKELSAKTGIKLVVTQNSHYLSPNDKRAHNTLMAIQENDESRNTMKQIFGTDDFSFINQKTVEEYFANTREAIENTQKIADRCIVELHLGDWNFPALEKDPTRSDNEVVRDLAYAGLSFRNMELTDIVRDRIEYELKVIYDKGFSPYFLVVSDLLSYARSHGILTNIRGSVAGSLVTYLLGITNVDPLYFKLPFERFLNPERPSAPDIDMDFADNRRDEMLDYARAKYGIDNVAQIGTFGTMAARGAVRDVARAMKYPYIVGDRISKMIPMGSQGFPMTIERAIELNPDLARDYAEDRETEEIIDMARQLEGCARHISVHAAGVVISPTKLTDFTPIQLDTKGEGKIISQYDMYSIEDAGLLKFDFLGIRNLAILEDAVRIVRERYNVHIDLDTMPIDDQKTFAMLARGETMGLFQLNGSGMTKYLKELKPSTIFDINAMVALYRPGPIEMIPEYIKRKHNPDLIQYLDPRLESILDQSYGVITYQDDVMLTAIHLAGYSWLEADKLRKAMGKKIPAEMEAQKQKLHDGFIAHGLSEQKAQKLWGLIEPFAAYGFNKAHAASYGRVSYQTAYMKANFPAAYMTAILTAESGDTEKIAEIVSECRRMNIPILPPDVNTSMGGFSLYREENGIEDIRFGLHTIKNLGTEIGNAIIEERKRAGVYTSFSDFVHRVTHKNLNKKSLESLAKSGALDSLCERNLVLENLDSILEYQKEIRSNIAQDSLFGSDDAVHELKLAHVDPASQKAKLLWERELLGLFLSGHPLDSIRPQLERQRINIQIALEEIPDKGEVTLLGIIDTVKFVQKKGTNEPMSFFKFTDLSGSIEVGVFTKVFPIVKDNLAVDNLVLVKGKLSIRDDEKMLIAESVQRVEVKEV